MPGLVLEGASLKGEQRSNYVKSMSLALSRPSGHIFPGITPSLLCKRPGLVSWDPPTRIMHRGPAPARPPTAARTKGLFIVALCTSLVHGSGVFRVP